MTAISIGGLASFSKAIVFAEVLYHLTKILRPQKVLDMGTRVGISGSNIAAARRLKQHLSPEAFIVFEDIAWSASMGRPWSEIFADAGVNDFVQIDDMGVIGL